MGIILEQSPLWSKDYYLPQRDISKQYMNGEIVFDETTQQYLQYNGNTWEPIIENEPPIQPPDYEDVIECHGCGARDNIYKETHIECAYCGNQLKVKPPYRPQLSKNSSKFL